MCQQLSVRLYPSTTLQSRGDRCTSHRYSTKLAAQGMLPSFMGKASAGRWLNTYNLESSSRRSSWRCGTGDPPRVSFTLRISGQAREVLFCDQRKSRGTQDTARHTPPWRSGSGSTRHSPISALPSSRRRMLFSRRPSRQVLTLPQDRVNSSRRLALGKVHGAANRLEGHRHVVAVVAVFAARGSSRLSLAATV